jgi:hypothetical protein
VESHFNNIAELADIRNICGLLPSGKEEEGYASVLLNKGF